MSWTVDPVSQIELWVPEYATPESAIAREALRREGNLGVVRLYPDWGAIWPLWDSSSRDESAIVARLDVELKAAIRRWFTLWRREYHYRDGWPSAAIRDAWLREGDFIADHLQQALWVSAEVLPMHRVYSNVRRTGRSPS